MGVCCANRSKHLSSAVCKREQTVHCADSNAEPMYSLYMPTHLKGSCIGDHTYASFVIAHVSVIPIATAPANAACAYSCIPCNTYLIYMYSKHMLVKMVKILISIAILALILTLVQGNNRKPTLLCASIQ